MTEKKEKSCWGYTDEKHPNRRKSSSKWNQAKKVVAKEPIEVNYGGGVVNIKEKDTYYIDNEGDIIVGWHGTYNPPRGMDGNSML